MPISSGGLGVVKQRQVGQHLQGAVGGKLGQDGLLEGSVLDLQKETAVGHEMRLHFFKPWHTFG